MKTGEEYIESLKKLKLHLYLWGEQVESPAEHPMT